MPKIIDVDERRAELARAAARLIARSGISAATLREVAAEAGLTTGALTHYFGDKRELMLYTFSESLAGRKGLRATRDETDPLAALVQSLEGALPLDDDRVQHWMVSVAFCAEAAGDADLSRTQQRAYRDHRAYIARLARAAGLVTGEAGDDVAADGANEGERADALAERLLACANGIAVQALFDHAGWPPARQLTRLRELVGPLLRSPEPVSAEL
jgi:AcrR family transcriptional regulator